MTYVPRCSRPHFYFQHANLLFASGVPRSCALREDVHVVYFVIHLYSRNVLLVVFFSARSIYRRRGYL